MFKNKILKLFLFIAFIVFLPRISFAATLNFNPSVGSYNVGDTLRVKVFVSSPNTSVNAVSAKVSYPKDMLDLTSISKAGSVISLWAQEPSYSNANGTAVFEGVMLSGYNGSSGTIVTLVFKALQSGTANIKFSNAEVLANDGDGTNILSGTGIATLSIVNNKKETVKDPKIEEKVTLNKNIKIEEIKKNDIDDTAKRFLITPPSGIQDNTYTIAIDSMDVISWVDDGSHIFQAPDLQSGTHLIKITALDTLGNTLSGFVEFSTSHVSVPVITEYPTDLFADNYLVIKGTADKLSVVSIQIVDISTNDVVLARVSANENGKWSYVSDEKMPTGIYSLSARAITVDGLESDYSNPIKINIKENIFNKFLLKINSYLTILTPAIALLVLFLLILVYGLYHVKRFHKYLSRKLDSTESIIEKSFAILEEDADDEIKIFKKIRAGKGLSKEEQSFITKFKKDIQAAEKLILKEVKDLEK